MYFPFIIFLAPTLFVAVDLSRLCFICRK